MEFFHLKPDELGTLTQMELWRAHVYTNPGEVG